MHTWLIIILIIVGLFLLFVLAELIIGLYTYNACFKRQAPINPKDIDEKGMFGKYKDVLCKYYDQYQALPVHEEISIIGERGFKLKGVLTKADSNKDRECPNVMIFSHGWHSKGTYDTSFTALWPFDSFDVLAIDHMGHGDSESKYISFGILDCINVCHWVEKINEMYNHNCNIVLYGFSMGGNTVGLCADMTMENVKCIIDDCGFTGAYDQFIHIIKSKLLVDLAGIFLKVVLKLDIREKSTINTLANSKYPVLFIHGGDDNFVPTEMSRRNYEACSAEKELLIVPGASHALSCMTDTEHYIEVVRKFLDNIGITL